ncbi:MAG TPA: N-acylglucosamine 2-epimerase, partial [Armatimonadetes bacterium]|nr:N-acylglucosamine 2-epimerase [Armatimonadota bacterium]
MKPYTLLDKYGSIYRDELVQNTIPFWEKHCPDAEYGAYLTCLDRDGSVYHTEKFMWMQWRVVWMLSELYS